MTLFFPVWGDGAIEMVCLQEVANLAGGHFSGSGQEIGVGVAGGRLENAVFNVDVAGVGPEMFPTIGGGFAGEAPGVVGVPDEGMGTSEEFEQFEEGGCCGEGVVGFDKVFHVQVVLLFFFLSHCTALDGLVVFFFG